MKYPVSHLPAGLMPWDRKRVIAGEHPYLEQKQCRPRDAHEQAAADECSAEADKRVREHQLITQLPMGWRLRTAMHNEPDHEPQPERQPHQALLQPYPGVFVLRREWFLVHEVIEEGGYTRAEGAA